VTEEWPDVSIVRKQKAGGKIMTAGQLRDQGDIEKLIQQHNGYKLLNNYFARFPYWESAKKDLDHGYDLTARSCNTICDLVSGLEMNTFTQTS
jgi:hypothetical protein